MFTQDDRDFLKEWVVDPLAKQISAIHTEENCINAKDFNEKTRDLSDDMKMVKKQIYIWVGGLGTLVFIFGIITVFTR